MPSCKYHRRAFSLRRGFTLVELLVVIAIIGILVSLLLPAVQMARESARRSQCTNNMRQIGLALHSFHEANRKFPAGCVGCEYIPGKTSGYHQLAWSVFILPHLEQSSLYDRVSLQHDYYSDENREAGQTVLSVYLCPSTTTAPNRRGKTTGDKNGNGTWDPGDDLAYTDYGGIFGVGANAYSDPPWDPPPPKNGVLVYEDTIVASDIRDGLSNTIIVGEDTGRGVTHDSEWINGQNIFDVIGPINETQNNELWSDHSGGVNVAFCDGHMQWLSENIDMQVLFALCSRSMGEVISADDY